MSDALRQASPVRIRRATPTDNEVLAILGAETFRQSFAQDIAPEDMAVFLAGAFSPERQSDELADVDSCFLIAESGNEAIGYVRLEFGHAPADVQAERPLEINRLYLRQSWIGKGVGASLMKACLGEAKAANCDILWLDVWERNRRAIEFYSKWGFRMVGEQVLQLGKEMQRVLLMARST